MPKATWKGHVLAESDKTKMVDGNYYFPPDAINRKYFRESKTTTVCPWIGTASYFHIYVDSDVNVDAAWYYPSPKAAANSIKDHVAFWRGVEVEE